MLGVMLASLAIGLVPHQLLGRLNETVKSFGVSGNLFFAFAMSFGYGILVYCFPMAYDPYGDAVRFQDHLDKVASVSPLIYDYLFGFSLDAWSGEKSVLALVSVASYHLDLTHAETFRVLDAFSAVIFSFCWIVFLDLALSEKRLSVPLYFAGLIGPFSMVFYGHAEIYAPAIAIIMLWVVIMTIAFRKKSLALRALLLVVNFLVIKLHPIGVMLIPSSVIASVTGMFCGKLPSLHDKRLLPIVLIPLIIIGLSVYFFILKDHIDDRSLQVTAKQYDHLFLPLFSPDPPLHKYNLLSFNHILDFLNVLLMASPIMLIFFILVVWYQVRSKFGVSELFLHLLLTLTLILMLLFAINPLLSMPMDWDLFMLFVPLMFGCAVTGLTPELKRTVSDSSPLILGIAFLSTSFIISCQDVNNISDRLRSIAIHVHDTYYEWTMNITDRSFSISSEPDSVLKQKRNELRKRLRSNAQESDREFAEFLRQDAKRSYKVYNDYDEAFKFLNDALEYNPHDGNNHLTGVELNFQLGNMEQAFLHGKKLVEMEFPDLETSLRIAIHCALEAEAYDEAQKLCFRYLNNFESDFILKVYTRLVAKNQVGSLKLMFQRNP